MDLMPAEPLPEDAPELEAPELEAPELEAPELEAPELEAPESEAPELEAPEGARSVGRALCLLRLLGTAGLDGATLAWLVARSALAKPTCRRLLVALICEGMVEQDAQSRRYFLGRETYLIGMAAADRHGLHRIALDGVSRLAQATGDAAFLQVRQGDSIVCLAREDGDWPLRSHVLKAGDRHLLGAGAGGLAVLAALGENEVQAFLQRHGEAIRQRYPLLAPRLPALIAETRQRGYAMNRGAIFPGSWGMGMAIREPNGRVEACLSLAAIEGRMQPEREGQLAALLAAEVRLVEQRLVELRLVERRAARSRRRGAMPVAVVPSDLPRKRSA